MLKKLLPVALILAGLAGGIGAGVAMKAPAEDDEATSPCGDLPEATPTPAAQPAEDVERTFLKMPNQFVVPVVRGDRVAALVVMSLTLEIDGEMEDQVYKRLPKLRDGFLRAILDHANTGGFDGQFTSNGSMGSLRRAFMETGQAEFPAAIHDVLILDINRQDFD